MANFLSSFTLSSERDNYNNFVGIRFTVTSSVGVTQLGIRKGTGATGLHTVYVVDDATLTVVGSVDIDITAAAVGALTYASVAVPFNLTSGRVYDLVTQGDSGGGQNWADSSPCTIASGFTSPVGIYNSSASPTGGYSPGVANQMFYGLDFVYGVTVPTTMRVTQVALEQWASIIPPQMQVTQTMIEQWASTGIVIPRLGGQAMVLTGIGPVMVSE